MLIFKKNKGIILGFCKIVSVTSMHSPGQQEQTLSS